MRKGKVGCDAGPLFIGVVIILSAIPSKTSVLIFIMGIIAGGVLYDYSS